jgi:glycosyltransferase involved in cell wall biosynthesis
MRILFALPGLHRQDRGAEIAFISVAKQLAKIGENVTLIGSGESRTSTPYLFKHVSSLPREKFEHFPSIPFLRNESAYEEFTFIPGLLRAYRPSDYDVTLTCSYPFTNWALRRSSFLGSRPPHVFVTQNGDWPASARNSEFRFFGCEGLICINPDFFERNKERWPSELIPNGVNCERFCPAPAQRSEFGLPTDRLVVLMVSALIPSKRVKAGIEAVNRIPQAHLVVAGDGPLRQETDALATKLLPGRFTRLSVPPDKMPRLYQSSDVFLHLSRDEPFGNVFLEAMATGLPVVAYNSARLRWIVGENEFLVDSDGPAEIATAIEQARAASPSKKTERLRRAETFSWERVGVMYRDFLRKIVSNSH